MRKSKIILFIGFTVLSFLVSSCYKEANYYTEDYDLTITHYDNTFDFTTNKTFYLRDSVGLISDYIEKGDNDWKAFYGVNGASKAIKTRVRQQLLSLGYTEISDSLQDADFAVNMVATLTQNQGYVYYPGYWWGYPGYWGGYGYGWGYGGGWGLGYGGYYPWYGGGYSYTYETGNLMIEFAEGDSLRAFVEYMKQNPDGSPSDPNAPELKFIWSSFIDGLVDDGTTTDRVLNGIDEAFDNSSYLKIN